MMDLFASEWFSCKPHDKFYHERETCQNLIENYITSGVRKKYIKTQNPTKQSLTTVYE